MPGLLRLIPFRAACGLGLLTGAPRISVMVNSALHTQPADGLGAGRVTRFQLDPDGTVWVATEGGLSRLKNGHVATLTSKSGLPCNTVHWVIEDNDHSLWLYMPCGLTRIARSELDAWGADVDKEKDSRRTVQATVFDISDGVRTQASSGYYNPQVTKSLDGKLCSYVGTVSVLSILVTFRSTT